MPAPIILFVYNRPWHAEQTLEALMQNELADISILYIYADGPKANATNNQITAIKEVRHLIRTKQWCREVHIVEAEKNQGLANSIIEGVTKIVNQYGKIIVLEDDLITSKGFLTYMNTALDKYEAEEKIMQISGYMFPLDTTACEQAILLPFIASWGWGTWNNKWQHFDPLAKGYEVLKTNKFISRQFDLDGTYSYSRMLIAQMEEKNLDSWAIRWWWTVFKRNGLVVYPDKSLTKNIGFGTEATHTMENNPFADDSFNNLYSIKYYPASLKANSKVYKKVKNLFLIKVRDIQRKSLLFTRLKQKLYRFMKKFDMLFYQFFVF